MPALPAFSAASPYAVRVVLLSTYRRGLQPWIDREGLAGPVAVGAFGELYLNDRGCVGLVTGMGAINATASTLAFGLDPRFDVSRAYWFIAGLGGIDPEDAALGSAVWSEWIVDGDLVHEIDAREIPPDWSTGRLVLNTARPFAPPPPRAGTAFGVREAYRLNGALCAWALRLTQGIALADTPAVAAFRADYAGNSPAAAAPPRVLRGDVIAASTYWHGRLLNDWANRWVEFWTGGAGRMVITTMEDAGRAAAVQTLAAAGRADFARLLCLRTGCNYSRPPAGRDVVRSLGGDTGHDPFIGEAPCLENMIRVGGPVLDALLAGWARYERETPA